MASTTLGEFYRIALNSTGHQVHYDYDFESRTSREYVEPFSDHNYIELRTVPNASFHDAFFRPMIGVRQEYRFTDVDPEEFEAAILTGHIAWDVPARLVVHEDFSYPSTSCEGSECTTEVRETRRYPRDETYEDVNWGSLEGKILTIGKAVSFNRTVEWTDDDGLTHGYRFWLNYTALRESKLKGERVFVVQPSQSLQNLYPQNSPKPSQSQGAPVLTSTGPKPPKATHLLYLSSRAPVPVKEEMRSPFEFDGQWYWYNSTQVLEVYEPGTETVPWGEGESLPKISVMPGLTKGAAKDFFAQTGGELRHTLKEAYDAIRADPLLMDYRAYMQANPDAMPFAGSFYPDATHGAYTWRLLWDAGTQDPQARQQSTESRLQSGPGLPDVGVVQNRDSGPRFGFVFGTAPTKDQWDDLQLVGFEDLYKSFRPHWTKSGPLGVSYLVGSDWFTGNELQGSVHFFEPTTQTGGTLGGLFTFQVWRATDSISVSALDGGLLAFNQTWAYGLHEWPWTPDVPFPIASSGAKETTFPGWGAAGFAHRAETLLSATQNG